MKSSNDDGWIIHDSELKVYSLTLASIIFLCHNRVRRYPQKNLKSKILDYSDFVFKTSCAQ